jgi:hypothetical protein
MGSFKKSQRIWVKVRLDNGSSVVGDKRDQQAEKYAQTNNII